MPDDLDPKGDLQSDDGRSPARTWPAKVAAIAALVSASALMLAVLGGLFTWVIDPVRTDLGAVKAKLEAVDATLRANGERLAKVEVRVDHLDQQIQRLHESLSTSDAAAHRGNEAMVSLDP
jgi:septal ring factor EnvC (AmiA/AmiB activator)